MLCLITPFNQTLKTRSIKNQINYLSGIIDSGYDDQLQNRFPEGKLFSNALLALSTIEFCDKQDIKDQKYSRIVDKCIRRIQSENTLSIFNENIEPKYGMFYCGWTNLVYSTYINSNLYSNSILKIEVEQESEKINTRLNKIQNDSLRVLNSYWDSNWPADNLIGVISINSDKLKLDWINKILETGQHPNGLIHHSGSNRSKIRGSSSAMITYCLNKASYKDIENYNEKFKETFIDTYLGIQLVKENEDGSNNMDIDSGPVVFGYGASATIMNIKTQASFKSTKSKITWAVMNLISFPINIFNKKYYLMKKEPMLDLFMLWGSTEL